MPGLLWCFRSTRKEEGWDHAESKGDSHESVLSDFRAVSPPTIPITSSLKQPLAIVAFHASSILALTTSSVSQLCYVRRPRRSAFFICICCFYEFSSRITVSSLILFFISFVHSFIMNTVMRLQQSGRCHGLIGG